MKNVTFISAGAGSGKTYTLTQKIVEMVKNGDCRSDQIILTTFTKVAANELREKVRSALYAAGFYDAAMNIDNAAIGTIHSVAYQFLSRYWYLLGISANVTIMPEENSSFYISQSLSSLPTEDDLLLFDRVFKAFDVKKYDSIRNSRLPYPDFWKDELKSIIDKTVELCISEEQLEKAREDSKKLLEETIKWNGYEISQDEIGNLIKWTNELCSTGKLAQDIEKKIKDSLPSVESYDSSKKGNQFPINHFIVLAKAIAAIKTPAIKKDEKYKEIFEKTAEIAEQLPRSKHVSELIEEYIDKIFDLAKQWKSSYEDFKRERCLLDNGDLLQKFYELLNKDEVANDIKSRYKVALVDEFQDCSPLQVESFKLLSDIMEQSIWVGDIKQAIYGFRGSNPELVKTLIGEIKKKENGNKFDSLEYCWRSSETIVNLVNNVFIKVFDGQIDAGLVKLKIPKERKNSPKEQTVRYWNFEGGNEGDRKVLIVDELEKFIEESGYSYKDIAILFRANEDVKGCAAELKTRGIPYNIKLDNNAKDNLDDVSTFLNAVISFVARNGNELSKAIIANRVEDGYSVSKILSDRLNFLAKNKETDEMWLSESDVINRLLALRKTVGNQSVSAAVETIVAEINLIDLVKRIDSDTPAYNYCSSLVAKAVAYEDSCYTMGLSSTLLGFASYLQENPISFPGDENGITIMTYHKSKGLEWPCVILCSLNKKVLNKDRDFYGVLTMNTAEETLLRLVPMALKNVIEMDVENHDFFSQLVDATCDEAKRLMYVGMTRPKEQIILVTEGKADDCDLWLKNIGCKSIHSNANRWYDTDVIHVSYIIEKKKNAATSSDTDTEIDDISSLVPKEFKSLKQAEQRETFDDKFVSPSMVKSVGGIYTVEKVADFAGRLTISSLDKKDSTIGNFIHHAMCLWNGDESVLESLAVNYGVKVETDKLVASIKSFWKWMEETYGKPIALERELPFCFTNKKGQVVNGEIDLVYRTEKGDVLVDYKTYQGSAANLTDADNDFYAGKYSGQIALYEEALKRDGRNVIKRLICYLSLGVIISFEDKK